MNIIYTCPKCGGDLCSICIAINPPIEYYQCQQCGWTSDEKREEVMRIPLQNDDDESGDSEWDMSDYCYECRGYGDDYIIDDGELVNVCSTCFFNEYNWEDGRYKGNDRD